MALANALFQSIVSTLDLCRRCTAKIEEPAKEAVQSDFDIYYDNSRISRAQFATTNLSKVVVRSSWWTDVKFINCDLHNVSFEGDGGRLRNVIFKNCRFVNVRFTHGVICNTQFSDLDWQDVSFDFTPPKKPEPGAKITLDYMFQNVHFADCHFHKTAIQNTRMINTYIYNVDMTEVEFKNLKLKDTHWIEQRLEHAFVSPESHWKSTKLPGSEAEEVTLSILSQSALTKTTGGLNWREGNDDPRKQTLINNRKLKTMCLDAAPNAAGRKLLELPEPVLKTIVNMLFPGDSIKVTDYANCHRLLKKPNFQSTYLLKGDSVHRTHIGWHPSHDPLGFKGKRGEAPQMGHCTRFLRASRKCYELGVSALYDRTFIFDENVEAGLTFLHDHRKKEHMIKDIKLVAGPKNIAEAWRHLFNVLVHERMELRKVELIVKESFWQDCRSARNIATAGPEGENANRWCRDAESAVGWNDWTVGAEERRMDRSFLEHVARLPLRVKLSISIEGAEESEKRKAFAKAVEQEIRERRKKRPTFTKPRDAPCKGRKEIEKCCFWVARDEDWY